MDECQGESWYFSKERLQAFFAYSDFLRSLVRVISSCTQSPRHLDKSHCFQKTTVGVDPLDTAGKNKDNLMKDNKSGKGSIQIQRFLPSSWLPLEL